MSLTDFIKSLFSSSNDPTEEDINKNISILLDFPWFRELFEHPEIRGVIETNPEVREMIGRENVKNLKLYPSKQLKLKNKFTNAIFFNIK